MYFASYKRYWEPNTFETLTVGGVVGAITTAVTHPFDYFKTKSQLRLEGIGMRQKGIEMGVNPLNVFREFHSRGYGLSHIFTGLHAAIASRVSFLLVRNLVYKTVYDLKKPAKPTNDLTHREKMVISGFASVLGAIAANPFDIIKIRQISDLGRSEKFTRGYENLGEAFKKVGAEKAGIWRGLGANMTRAALLGTVMIYPYDRVKEHMYTAFGDVFTNTIGALFVASIWGAVFTLPFDNIRTRLMNQYPDKALNRLSYSSVAQVVKKSMAVEGSNCFFVGMLPHFTHTLLFATLTLYVTDLYTTARKRGAGLPEHQI